MKSLSGECFSAQLNQWKETDASRMASDAAASKSILIRMGKCSRQIHKCDCFDLLGLSQNCSDESENCIFIIFSKVGMGAIKVCFVTKLGEISVIETLSFL